MSSDGQTSNFSEDFLLHVETLEQEVQLLREQQTKNFQTGIMDEDFESDRNNEILDSENRELVEKMTAMLGENHKIKEENEVIKKSNSELKEEIKNLNHKLDQTESRLRKTMQNEEKKKDLDYEIQKLRKEVEDKDNIHAQELDILFSIAQEVHFQDKESKASLLKDRFVRRENALFSDLGIFNFNYHASGNKKAHKV